MVAGGGRRRRDSTSLLGLLGGRPGHASGACACGGAAEDDQGAGVVDDLPCIAHHELVDERDHSGVIAPVVVEGDVGTVPSQRSK